MRRAGGGGGDLILLPSVSHRVCKFIIINDCDEHNIIYYNNLAVLLFLQFIVEKDPEWDGGSRGRVKSKKKGGVGWH